MVFGVGASEMSSTLSEFAADCETPVRAKNFDEDMVLINTGPQGAVNIGVCTVDGPKSRKGVKVSAEVQVLDTTTGDVLAEFNQQARTKRSCWGEIDFVTPPPIVPGGPVTVITVLDLLGNKRLDGVRAYSALGRDGDCMADNTTACLLGNRFEATIDWTDPFNGETRQARVGRTSGNEARFDFAPLSDELDVRVLDACGDSDFRSLWVFYGSTTNLEYDLTVTDTESGLSRSYTGPNGLGAPPITDTRAFATCP
jgi:hypothetical protein